MIAPRVRLSCPRSRLPQVTTTRARSAAHPGERTASCPSCGAALRIRDLGSPTAHLVVARHSPPQAHQVLPA